MKQIKTDIYIKSNSFPPYPNEDDAINPGRFGKRLAEFVKLLLEKEHIEVADVYATDYSYELRIDQFKFRVYISTGNIDATENEFLIAITPKKAFVKQWVFKKIPTKETIDKIYTIIMQGLDKASDIEIL